MKILYAAHKYDYGKRERGFGFEHANFFDPLHQMGHDILYFDLRHLMPPAHRSAFNAKLEEIVRAEKPDLLFSAPFADELEQPTLRKISKLIPTVAWFCDDHWKFDTYTRTMAPCFTWSVTTALSALPKYEEIRYRNVMKSQWAANHYSYRKLDLPLKYDVTFVGQPHGTRRPIIEYLIKMGINVQAFGNGWENGRVSQEQMVEIFNQSRINLNLSNSFIATPPPKMDIVSRGMRFIRRKVLAPSPAPNPTPTDGPPVWDSTLDQIKGRNFEVPGCGGFTLTGAPENLGDYFQLGREVVSFENAQQLLERIQYFLSHEDERAAIAEAGHRRMLSEHTYVHRFTEIFKKMGLACESAEAILARGATPGSVTDLLPDV